MSFHLYAALHRAYGKVGMKAEAADALARLQVGCQPLCWRLGPCLSFSLLSAIFFCSLFDTSLLLIVSHFPPPSVLLSCLYSLYSLAHCSHLAPPALPERRAAAATHPLTACANNRCTAGVRRATRLTAGRRKRVQHRDAHVRRPEEHAGGATLPLRTLHCPFHCLAFDLSLSFDLSLASSLTFLHRLSCVFPLPFFDSSPPRSQVVKQMEEAGVDSDKVTFMTCYKVYARRVSPPCDSATKEMVVR